MVRCAEYINRERYCCILIIELILYLIPKGFRYGSLTTPVGEPASRSTRLPDSAMTGGLSLQSALGQYAVRTNQSRNPLLGQGDYFSPASSDI